MADSRLDPFCDLLCDVYGFSNDVVISDEADPLWYGLDAECHWSM